MRLDHFLQQAKEDPELLYKKLFKQLPATMICNDCGDLFQAGSRCKNYIKGKMNHISMSHYKDNYENSVTR